MRGAGGSADDAVLEVLSFEGFGRMLCDPARRHPAGAAHLEKKIIPRRERERCALHRRDRHAHQHVPGDADEDGPEIRQLGPERRKKNGLGVAIALIVGEDLQGDGDPGRVPAVIDGRRRTVGDGLDERINGIEEIGPRIAEGPPEFLDRKSVV